MKNLFANLYKCFFKLCVAYLSGGMKSTPNSKNPDLKSINGSATFTDGGEYYMMIQGEGKFGTSNKKSQFSGNIVVNGSAKVKNASFEDLEINGQGHLEDTQVNKTLHVSGNLTLINCRINTLITYGWHTKVDLINSSIQNNLKYQKKISCCQ